MGFKEAGARPMPRLANVGSVVDFPAAKPSKSGVYVVQKFELRGYGTSRNHKNNMFLYQPSWLTEGFDPESLEEFEGGNKMLAVYRNNVSEKGKISTLQGLCGCDEEKFDELAGRLFALNIQPEGLETEADVTEVLTQVTDVLSTFLIKEGNGNKLGYILGQQTSKTDEVDASTGKPVYVSEPYYEVKEYFDPHNEKKIASLRKAADKSEGKFKINFDDVPF